MRKFFGIIMAILAVLAIIAVFGATYFLVIEPNNINKPDIPKPLLPENAAELAEQGQSVITPTHLTYLLNEMDGYKLKAAPISKNPAVMEFYLTDTQTYFTTVVTDNIPETMAGKAVSPDVRLSGTQQTISKFLENNPNAKVEKINLPDLKTSEAIKEFNKVTYNQQTKNCLRIWPQDNDTEGFFVTKIRKL